MAIINKDTGEYLKISIIAIHTNKVCCDIYESKEHRLAGDTKFKKHGQISICVPTLSESAKEENSDKNIKDALVTLAYKKIMELPEYSNWGSDEVK